MHRASHGSHRHRVGHGSQRRRGPELRTAPAPHAGAAAMNPIDTFWIQPIRATPVPARGSGRVVADGEEDCESDGSSSGSDASACKVAHASACKLSDLSASDKDYFELCSSDDSDVEVAPEAPAHETGKEGEAAAADAAASDSEDPEAARGALAAQHSHTAWQNDYFVLTDNWNYPAVRH